MKIFYISLPFEQTNSGDVDYCLRSVEFFRMQGVAAEYVTSSKITNYDNDKAQSLMESLSKDKNNQIKFEKALETFYEDLDRQKLASDVKQYLISDSAANKVLNLQLRPPESGFLLSIEDLRELKESGLRIITTCHEYKLNDSRPWLQWAINKYLDVAEEKYFFSKADSTASLTTATQLSPLSETLEQNALEIIHKFTTVPPTVADNISYFSDAVRPPNIITFGMIRNNKGFEESIVIAKAITTHIECKKHNVRVILTGSSGDEFPLVTKIIMAKFGFEGEDIQQTISTGLKDLADNAGVEELLRSLPNSGQLPNLDLQTQVEITNLSLIQLFIQEATKKFVEVLPIDIFLDISEEELPLIFAKAKYAAKYDEKGWANNASSLINILRFGCVLYTGNGMCTDQEDLIKNAMVLPPRQYCLKSDSALKESEVTSKTMQSKINKIHKTHFATTVKNPSPEQDLIQAIDVLNDVAIRERWLDASVASGRLLSNYDNQATLKAAEKLLKYFTPSAITIPMIYNFIDLFPDLTEYSQEIRLLKRNLDEGSSYRAGLAIEAIGRVAMSCPEVSVPAIEAIKSVLTEGCAHAQGIAIDVISSILNAYPKMHVRMVEVFRTSFTEGCSYIIGIVIQAVGKIALSHPEMSETIIKMLQPILTEGCNHTKEITIQSIGEIALSQKVRIKTVKDTKNQEQAAQTEESLNIGKHLPALDRDEEALDAYGRTILRQACKSDAIDDSSHIYNEPLDSLPLLESLNEDGTYSIKTELAGDETPCKSIGYAEG